MKYYSLSQDGMKNYSKTEIKNPDIVFKAIDEKKTNKHWHLSVNGNGFLDCNPAAPLFIYGAKTTYLIIDENNNILFNYWTGEHKETITQRFLENCK